MKFYICGHNGWIGAMMCRLLDEKSIPYVKSTSRAENVEELEKEIAREAPTHIMSFIGRTHGTFKDKYYSTIDYLEQEGKVKENVRDNLFSPMILSILSVKYNAHYTYLGTGCIFKYDEQHKQEDLSGGFLETDVPNFFGSSYSIVKGYTDQLMKLQNSLNLRIRMPITDKLEPRNFITKITKYEKICSIPNSMTVLDELLPIALDMATKKTTGTFNFTNPGVITHNEILEMYRDMVDPNFKWENFSQEEQRAILDADRSNNLLNTKKLEELYPEVKPIQEAVKEVFERMKSRTEEKPEESSM